MPTVFAIVLLLESAMMSWVTFNPNIWPPGSDKLEYEPVLPGSLPGENTDSPPEADNRATNKGRRDELTRLAGTMCNGKANNARKYKLEVEANRIQLSDVEQRDLISKFAFIHEMLSLEYKGKNTATSLEEQIQCKDALRALQKQQSNKLSAVQKRWIDEAILQKWPVPAQ